MLYLCFLFIYWRLRCCGARFALFRCELNIALVQAFVREVLWSLLVVRSVDYFFIALLPLFVIKLVVFVFVVLKLCPLTNESMLNCREYCCLLLLLLIFFTFFVC